MSPRNCWRLKQIAIDRVQGQDDLKIFGKNNDISSKMIHKNEHQWQYFALDLKGMLGVLNT